MKSFLERAVVIFARKVGFERDPERVIPTAPGLIVSPADGDVVYVAKIVGTNIITKKGKREVNLNAIIDSDELCEDFENGWVIGVRMHFWNVHINRTPIAGVIQKIFSTGLGSFVDLIAKHFEEINARRIISIKKNERIKVLVVLIASFFARQIDCFIKEGDRVETGQRIGRIVLGSQVDLVLPSIVKLSPRLYEGKRMRVFAGVTVLARYDPKLDTAT